MPPGAPPLSPAAALAADTLARVRAEVHRVIIGQDRLIDRLLIGLLCNGHILVEGVPGLAKSLTVSTLARALDLQSVRIQFTPDLLPADLVGTEIFNARDGQFTIRKGPIFANFVLADEINRAPAKVQSALLEAMQERQVSIGGQTFPLDDPFLVIATQNPIEQEGTYPLPEAQLDRFLLKVRVDYPSRAEERQVLELSLAPEPPRVGVVASRQAILDARAAVHGVALDDAIRDYITQLVAATRRPADYRLPDLQPLIAFGASPRASISLALAARAHAFLHGRSYTTPDDVKAVAHEALRHRIITTYEADARELTPDDLIDRLLEGVDLP
ncbi:AAA family ATPase [Tepidiforma thermophila]|uniref:MoxR-like ATPase n=1 Tax=Tepidiforma thermophila (strain KCTC 52669 / CGMCC 1.13589 / G233) TaxID=2761530 RepID=A0A2A9HDE0_TEPT2|nr:MoxR family ATPase [Tepidiforma thermophila]PFG72819.1 MoxR-like ATPase [Tepidiforma thermophila]